MKPVPVHTDLISPILQFLTHLGVKKSVIAPGSRNAPLIRALLKSDISNYGAADERSAAFIALGMAMEEKRPVVVSCTSGTAALNLYPAVCEAWYARIPLIAITADRPERLIDQWDGQCIHQKALYEPHIGASIHLEEKALNPSEWNEIFITIQRCLSQKLPLHINIAMEEPLYSEKPGELLEPVFPQHKDPVVSEELTTPEHLERYDKVMILYGASSFDACAMRWPKNCVVLADILSGQRKLQTHDYWDALLSTQNAINKPQLQPNLLITFGMYSLSKGLKLLLRKNPELRHIHIDTGQGFGNMFETDAEIIQTHHSEPIIKAIADQLRPAEYYHHAWTELCREISTGMEPLVQSGWNDWSAVHWVAQQLGSNDLLHVSNSMPVRYLSLLNLPSHEVDVHSNRGTSGIDGCTSTALGASLCTERTTYILSGDIAFFYDINAFWNDYLHPNFKVILLNNGGGNIFSMIGGPEKYPEALKFQETPHKRTAQFVAEDHGLLYFKVDSFEELTEFWPLFSAEKKLPALLEIRTNKSDNLTFYQQLKALTI